MSYGRQPFDSWWSKGFLCSLSTWPLAMQGADAIIAPGTWHMILKKSTYWALKALLYMAQLSRSSATLAAEVAGKIGAPPYSLSKVLRRLSLCGILISQRGANGGFFLARSPDNIS